MQTEDSGVDNPHLFTHLFHGGVILSSRKIDYDAASEEDVVKGLMQSQHRAVLKDLKIGTFDDKIDSYLGTNKDLLPRKDDSAAGPASDDAAVAAQVEAEATTEVAAEAPEREDEEKTAVDKGPALNDPIDLDAPPDLGPEGLSFEADDDTGEMESAPTATVDVAAATDEMPSVGIEGDTDELPRIEDDTGATTKVSRADIMGPSPDDLAAMAAEAQAAAKAAVALAEQAAAEAAHARELQEAAAAAKARAAELEALAASHSKTQEQASSAHSGAISLDSKPSPQVEPEPLAEKKRRITQVGPRVDPPDSNRRRRHLPTATEMPAYKEETLGDPTVTFSSGGTDSKPAAPTRQAVPQQIIGERSGTYSMKRQSTSTTQRMNRRAPTSQRPRARTEESASVMTPEPARNARRSASGKAANPEPGRRRSAVVVSRPAVIIGAPPKMVGKGTRPAARKARGGSVFGKDLISEKSLDEVIMAYLSEDSSEE